MKYVSDLKELQGKVFDNVKDLEKAEKEVNEAVKAKEAALVEKKADLAKINTTANNYLKLVEENNKKRAELRKTEEEAYLAYKKELDDFAEKHQGYHLTYKKDGDTVEFQIEEAKQQSIEDFYKQLKESQASFSKFFNDLFWF